VKIVVCLKQVPDTETKIEVKPDGSGIVEEGIKYIMNPYDEFAVEEALRIREKFAQGEVIIVSLGPPRAQEAIRTALAMGADRAVHLWDDGFTGSDSFVGAKIMARALKDLSFDLILAGKQAVDDDCSQIPQILGELLDIPQVTVVEKLEISEDRKKALAYRRIEGGAREVVEVELPAIISCEKGLNEPRYASLTGIMTAKKKELKTLCLSELGLDPSEVGSAA
jgi:electron transfer flavoprotein beta subunit